MEKWRSETHRIDALYENLVVATQVLPSLIPSKSMKFIGDQILDIP